MPQPMSKGRTGSHNFPGTAPFRSPGLCRIGTARCAVTRTGYSDRRGLGPPVRPAQMPRQRGRCRDGRVKLLRLGVQAAATRIGVDRAGDRRILGRSPVTMQAGTAFHTTEIKIKIKGKSEVGSRTLGQLLVSPYSDFRLLTSP